MSSDLPDCSARALATKLLEAMRSADRDPALLGSVVEAMELKPNTIVLFRVSASMDEYEVNELRRALHDWFRRRGYWKKQVYPLVLPHTIQVSKLELASHLDISRVDDVEVRLDAIEEKISE